MSVPGYQLCTEHRVLFRVGTQCLTCPPRAFYVVHGRGANEEERYLFDERHSCNTAFVGPCRACAQARVVHDDGDEQPGSFPGRRGVWLVGGGRNHMGTLGGTPPANYSPYSQEVTPL
jgi:hypothetical protein